MITQEAAKDLLRELKHLVKFMEPVEATGLNIPGLATLNGARLAIEKAEGGALCSPDNPPFDTLPPTPSWSTELYHLGQDIRKRHPAHCRCSSKVVTAKLATIMRDTRENERMTTLLYIDRQHAKWCASEAWTKEGGKFSKGLEAWLNPARRLWENEPLAATVKADYVDRYAMESGI